MKKLTLLSLFVIVGANLFAQNCNYVLSAEVRAESGLTLRATPSLSGKVLAYVPAKAQVLACPEKGEALVVEGVSGNWRPVQYQQFTGYMFDGFLNLPAKSEEESTIDSLRQRSQELIRQSDSVLGHAADTSSQKSTGNDKKLCAYNLKATITAPSGLSLRQAPALGAKLIRTVAFAEMVLTCGQTEGPLTVGDLKGHWRPVMYQGKKGYMFDGYLQIESPENVQQTAGQTQKQTAVDLHPHFSGASKTSFLIETYNYCGNVEAINAGLLWYGVYPEKEEEGQGLFRVKPVELVIKLSTSKLSEKMEFDISTESDERSLFLMGLNRSLKYQQISIDDHSAKLRMLGNRILPGQSTALGGGLSLAATGSVESMGDCPELKNYRLLAKYKGGEQNLLKEIGEPGACGMPELYWYGDLSGDGLPEVIFVSVYKNRNVFTLLKSNPDASGTMLKKAASFEIVNCSEE